ncbi:Nonribosomal peptide synthetase [Tolypocladium paradoxum]|uniref:Nonribosomal peptide synthetase n=1 Tax=Tolypocladium paradoxum TaxID=94208 RepID=A0A2S4L6Y2_9HYPO|nr:Nonribosomal peptide synthetase [Tolypocladium paradoxum]
MAAVGQRRSSEPDYGRRLAPNVVDEAASRDPTRPFVFAPRSSKPEDGWAPVTYRQVANAVNHVAHIVAATVKRGSRDPFPTLAYVGPSDVRYAIIALACIKAGCKALFISPRNSLEGQMSLLEKSDCGHFWHAESFHSIVQPWIRARPMQVEVVPSAEEWLESMAAPFPYDRPFEDARWEPFVVLHTSGTTGIPKLIVVRQGSLAIADGFRSLPDYQGAELVWKSWIARAKKMFVGMPLFHAGGFIISLGFLGIFYEMPVALGMPDQPLSPELALKCLSHADVDCAVLPPSIVEELAQCNLSHAAGDALVRNGVILNNVISSTEVLPYAIYFQPRPELWQYFILNSEVMGAVWRCKDEREAVFELVLRRKDPHEPGDQPVFYTFPELEEWSTGDLYKRHPSLPDHWIFHGRADNVIVFSNGEKLNPVTIEDIVTGHPAIKGALVVGQDRFQPALILEPHIPPKDDAEAKALVDNLWPLIEEANKASVAHGHIVRQLIALSDAAIPFPRAAKGTIQRGLAVKAYAGLIDDMYERAEEAGAQEAVSLHLGNEAALTRSIIELFEAKLGVEDIQPDTDFFSLGVDSLQVIRLSNVLRGSFRAAGMNVDRSALAPRAIYANPTPQALAGFLHSAAKDGGESKGNDTTREIKAVEGLVSKYTKNLPAPVEKPGPLDHGQTVLLTGSTGSLGAYLLDRLCTSPHVRKIIALNRGDGGESRQTSVGAARGLGTDFSKVEFLGADVSLPYLGLGDAKYDELRSTADRIIHNAWPVNFNISIASFEPHIRGVRHLVDFSSAAAKRVPIIFISSVSTAAAWKSTEPVPEQRLEDPALAEMGYGRSKLAGSLILDAAARESGVPTASVRVGQIAGPKGRQGLWNKQEFIPTLIASSVYLGMLPEHLGPGEDVDWMPIEDVAGLILDVSGVTVPTPGSEISGYFHGVNPAKTTWGELAAVLLEHYDGRIKTLASFEEWVAALERSAGTAADVARNPGIKLLDTYKGMLQASQQGLGHVNFDMKRTISHSPTGAHLGPVTPDLLRNWCAQWEY